MTIRAKFKCTSVDTSIPENDFVRFDAVYSSDPDSENYSWSKWTPAGSLTLNISNSGARGKFIVGEEYYLDIFGAAGHEPKSKP